MKSVSKLCLIESEITTLSKWIAKELGNSLIHILIGYTKFYNFILIKVGNRFIIY